MPTRMCPICTTGIDTVIEPVVEVSSWAWIQPPIGVHSSTSMPSGQRT